MKNRLRTSFLLLAVLAMRAGAFSQTSVLHLPLNDGWQFRAVADTEHPGAAEWHKATLPGAVHVDLQHAGVIPDPFVADNEKRLQWIGKEDWEYRTTIEATPQLLARKHIEIVFDGLDTFADVSLNDKPLLSANNMFRSWRAEIRPALHSGSNALRVVFHSPYKVMSPQLAKLPYILPGSGYEAYDPAKGIYPVGHYIRTAGYEYGWDWGPKLVTMGLWRPVHLEAWDEARITELHLEQRSVNADRALLTAEVEVQAEQAGSVLLELDLRDADANNGTGMLIHQQEQLDAGINHLVIPLRMEKPHRWFPAGYGAQNLYRVTAKIQTVATHKTIDESIRKIGLRSVELRRQPDTWGTSFTFVVNGIPIFAKGANVIPMDSFPGRVTEERERALLTSARDANMNMIRMWGGGYYQTDSFYSIADELGLMVWQEFAFGGGMVPGDKEFQQNVRAEAEEQVRRLRDHASIVLWCGNNEVETAWDAWGDREEFKKSLTPDQRERVWQDYLAVFREILAQAVAQYGGGVPYWSSSPSADFEDRANNDHNGDMHFWDVWSGKAPVQKYSTVKTRFLSEYGFQGMPDPATVQAFAGKEEDLSAPPLASHERFVKGFDRMHNYLTQEVGEPRDFASFNYLSQFLQAEAIRLEAEHLRSQMPQTMGSLYWQLNDCWPVVSWASVDYFGRPKALQYYARRFYAPLLIAPEFRDGRLEVHLVSDQQQPIAGELRIRILDLRGKEWMHGSETVTVAALSSQTLHSIDTGTMAGFDPSNTVAVMEWWSNGSLLASNHLFFSGTKPGKLTAPKITTNLTQSAAGQFTLELRSDVVARAVEVRFADPDAKLSDNFVDLLPGVPLRLQVHSSASAEELRSHLQLLTLATSLR